MPLFRRIARKHRNMMITDPLIRNEDNVVLDIADMIRRDGSRLYGGAGECAFMGSLCGLSAGFSRDGDIMIIKGADLHVEIILSVQPVDDSDGVERYRSERTEVKTKYHVGDVTVLRAWHKDLCAYRRSMRPNHSSVVGF